MKKLITSAIFAFGLIGTVQGQTYIETPDPDSAEGVTSWTNRKDKKIFRQMQKYAREKGKEIDSISTLYNVRGQTREEKLNTLYPEYNGYQYVSSSYNYSYSTRVKSYYSLVFYKGEKVGSCYSGRKGRVVSHVIYR